MKGIILAGGSGTRLYPSTLVTCKQLLPIFDKPLIYYPLSTLMSIGIKEILIISSPKELPSFINLLGNGSNLGIKILYEKQDKPNGIAESFIIGKKFIGREKVALILGDNIFYGLNFNLIKKNLSNLKGGHIFLYPVPDPQRYGVAKINLKNKISSIIEKPKENISDLAITGLYFYDNNVIKISQNLKPSKRKELEITDVNKYYLKKGMLNFSKLDKGDVWLDAGTHTSLLQASQFVQTIQARQQINIGCIEEIAFQQKWINEKKLKMISKKYKNSYGQYLKLLLKKY